MVLFFVESKYSQWALLRSHGEQRGSAGSQRVCWHLVSLRTVILLFDITNLALHSVSTFSDMFAWLEETDLSTSNACCDGMMDGLTATILLLAVGHVSTSIRSGHVRHRKRLKGLYEE